MLKTRMLRLQSLPLFALVAALCFCFSPVAVTAAGSPAAVWQEEESSEAEDGQADLDKATEKKLGAQTLRDLDEVCDLCNSAIEKGLNEEGVEFAKSLWASALYQYATRIGQDIFQRDPPDRRWQFYRRQALSRLEKAIELRPEMAEAYYLTARYHALAGGETPLVQPLQIMILLRQNEELPNGNLEGARLAIEKAVEFSESMDAPVASEVYVWNAVLIDDQEKQIELLNKSLELLEKNAEALRIRSLVKILGGEPEAAAEDFRKLMEIEPENAAYRQSLIQALTQAGMFEEAIAEVDKLVEEQPENPAIYMLRAGLNLEREDFEAAVADVNKTLELQPDEPNALLFRARAYLELEEFEKALADADRVLELQPENGQAILTRSIVNTFSGDYPAAIEDIKSLMTRAPNNPELMLRLALLYYAESDYENALTAYGQIIEQDEQNFQARRGRGDVYLSLGKHFEAADDYKVAYEVDPEDSALLNNYAWLLATSPDDEIRDGKLSTEMALKACEITEYEKAHILSTLASGYAEQGDFEKAKEWATKAVELAEDDEQREGLQEELDSYEKGEPWRERESPDDDKEEDKEEKSKEEGDESKSQDNGGDNKDADDKDADKSSGE